MRGHLSISSKNPAGDAERFVEIVAQRLQDLIITADGQHVRVRVGIFRLANTTSHPLKGASSAEFRVTPQAAGVLVEYEVRLTGLAWTFGGFAVIVSVLSLSAQPKTLWNAVGPFGAVVLTFALNWIWIRVGTYRFLRRVGDDVVAAAGRPS